MVKQIVAAVLLLALCLGFSGCSLKKWWGEEPQKPGVVSMPSTAAECLPMILVLEGSEAESQRTFECWAGQFGNLWTQVAGKERFVLSDDEIESLVRDGVIKLSGNTERDVHFVFAVKRLFNIPSPLKKEHLDSWIKLAGENRSQVREFYLRYLDLKEKRAKLRYSDFVNTARTIAPFLRQMTWSMDTYEFTATLQALLNIQDREVLNAFRPAASMFINLIDAVCPMSAPDVWNGRELANCFVQITDHFQTGAAWFDFILDSEPMDSDRMTEIEQALLRLSDPVKFWFGKKELGTISTARWVEFSRSLGVNPPDNLIDSMDLIKRFNSESSGKFLHPTLFIRAFELMRTYHQNLFSGMPYFVEALRQESCQNSKAGSGTVEATSWNNCTLPGEVLEKTRDGSPVVDLALRVKNLKHGQLAAPFNGERFAWEMFYYAVAGDIIEAFGTKEEDGKPPRIISTEPGRNEDEVVQLITLGLQGYETVRNFVSNIERKLHKQPLEDPNALNKFRSLNPKGLAKLVTMTNDVLVLRTPQDRDALDKAIALFQKAKKSSLYMDRLALTAVMTLLDSAGLYREAYLKQLTVMDIQVTDTESVKKTQSMVRREEFHRLLGDILKANFPRTYESCAKFGFDISCGMFLDQLVPSADKMPEFVHVDDLDLLTIVASAVEGLLDTCDADSNGVLSWTMFDGADELDCAYVRLKDIVKRAAEADVIKISGHDMERVSVLLDFVNSNFATRAIGKAALMRGDRDHLIIHGGLWWQNKYATLGSIYGLASDVMDKAKVDELKKKKKEKGH